MTLFYFIITDTIDGGADGFALVIHNDSMGKDALGTGGCTIGYNNIQNSLAIEFDTYHNGLHGDYCTDIEDPDDYDDTDDDHIGIMVNGPDHGNGLNYYTESGLHLNDGQVHTVQVSYQEGILEVCFDDVGWGATPVMTAAVDLADILNSTDDLAWLYRRHGHHDGNPRNSELEIQSCTGSNLSGI